MVYDGGVGVVSIMRKSEKIKVMRAVHNMSWRGDTEERATQADASPRKNQENET